MSAVVTAALVVNATPSEPGTRTRAVGAALPMHAGHVVFCDHRSVGPFEARGEGYQSWPKCGEMHYDDIGVHLDLRNCPDCHSTLCAPLPGHVEDVD